MVVALGLAVDAGVELGFAGETGAVVGLVGVAGTAVGFAVVAGAVLGLVVFFAGAGTAVGLFEPDDDDGLPLPILEQSM